MITAIRDLGEWILIREKKEPLDILIEPIDPERYRYAVVIVVTGDSWKVELEEFDKASSRKYLYRFGSPRGLNYSPTAMITEIDKTYQNKCLAWFQKVLRDKNIKANPEFDLLRQIADVLERNKDDIVRAIASLLNRVKDGCVLTLKIDGKYLFEIPIFIDLFRKMIEEQASKITAEQQTCSVCGHHVERVMAGSSAYKFYTIDKPGFIAGGFDERRSWRNYPICSNCHLYLVEAKRFIEGNLRFSFYGLSYYLIPHFLWGKQNFKTEVMEVFVDMEKRKSLQESSVQSTITGEYDILEILKEESDYLMLHLLFMQKVQSAERILLHIPDVYPSRLRKLFAAKEEVENLFKKNDGEKTPYHFGRIRTFFYKSDDEKKRADLDKYFLEITASVFQGKSIDRHFVTTFFMNHIRKQFANRHENEQNFYFTVRDALMNTIFFQRLGLFRQVKEESEVASERFQPVFDQYGPYLQRPEQQALFLLGVLTQVLLDVQKKIRQAQPFAEELKNLRMNERDFIGLLPKIKEKLRQYESDSRYEGYERYFANVLGEEISQLLLHAMPGWKLTADEMNFMFCAGMFLKYKVYSMLKEQKALQE